MHTFKTSNGTDFHYHSDRSEVIMIIDKSKVRELDGLPEFVQHNIPKEMRLEISFEDMIEFIAEYVREIRSEKLDEMSAREVLDI